MFFIAFGVKQEQILVTGQARNDVAVHSNSKKYREHYLVEGYQHILYAPTWRSYAETKLFPFEDFNLSRLDDFLETNKIKIHLRLHPSFNSQKINCFSKTNNISTLGVEKIADISEVLFDFDLLITDYSSIYIDFLLTEKPLLFLPYDINKYEDQIGFSINYDKYTPGPKPTCMKNFITDIVELLEKNAYEKERKSVNKIVNSIVSGQCVRNAEIIREKAV